MLQNQPLLTKTGKINIEKELAELKGPKRSEIAARLKHAIEMGDLSENADYKAAKEDQGFIEGRIQELEAVLANSQIVDESETDTSTVQIGSKVTIQEGNDPHETYHIVGATEANTRDHKISYESPLGAALINHKTSDVVEVSTPGGKIHFKIIRIE